MPAAKWLTTWLWEKPFGSKGETIIVLDDDAAGSVVGYGTWKHVEHESVVQPVHIEIAWFAVHSDYQGVSYEDSAAEAEATDETETTDETEATDEAEGADDAPAHSSPTTHQGQRERTFTVAEVTFAEVERFAREHPDSDDSIPITLTCHIENVRGLAFYRRKIGMALIPDPKLQVERDVYYRLVR